MKEKFEEAYNLLYDIYPEEGLVYRMGFRDSAFTKDTISELRRFNLEQERYLLMMRTTIQLFEMKNKFPLRVDAKLFLLTNFNQMIVKPLVHLQDENMIDLSANDLLNTIAQDLNRILYYSLELKKEEKVSGHEIMTAIDKLWQTLESTKYELWG